MSKNSDLLNEIAEYCAREKIAESTFGLRAVNDGKLVSRLRAGNTITLDTYEKVRRLLEAQAAA